MLLSFPGHSGVPPKRANQTEDPGNSLPDELQPLYRDLRAWRNERAKKDGVPAYAIARNAMVAEICRRRPSSLAGLKEIEGAGEAFCEKYGREILSRIPAEKPGATQGGENGQTTVAGQPDDTKEGR